ncbi:protein translocase SEC6 [Punctularia strigosozonata HHB-11173 SS5]|uniref:protein translocase SEC6 n=1 Tax=Punctularia strigosozonata (strain HHB-11173) TaxID=741275 RepID=UPI0004417A70|nr:protein translocase SEC6 [Punctularia strigosozonata HHB-11173 SS5]EIN13972.1 protein translocase SEC6 [Punctularia strigosozonata HHB-11173 SS5]
MSEKLREYLEVPQQFVQDGRQFMTRCTKPSRKEFTQICKAVAIGFSIMGFIGYFVKLIHIPINNILGEAHRHFRLLVVGYTRAAHRAYLF